MMQLKACFVIPTYNEASNIKPLLQQLVELYGDGVTVLVVDDNSPDGTGEIARAFARSHDDIHVLTGEKRGLGVAYIRGIQHAIDELGAEVVVQMDADFSHDPRDAARLLERIAQGADVAIGSRYVKGGGVDMEWSLKRRLLSRWGNLFARWVAGLWGIRDCTAGFKAIRADVIRQAQLDRLKVTGYVFQVALLNRLMDAGAVIVEEPIYFKDRSQGTTKLGSRDIVEFFLQIWWLRILSIKTFIKFCITGSSGVFVNLGSFALLVAIGLDKFIASPVAIELSVIWNFFLNNFWTFRHRQLAGRKRIRGVKFNLVSLVSLSVSYSTFVLLSVALPDAAPIVHQGLSIIPAVLFNYFLNSFWTFKDTRG